MGVILRIYSELYTNLIKALHTIDVSVTDAVFLSLVHGFLPVPVAARSKA